MTGNDDQWWLERIANIAAEYKSEVIELRDELLKQIDSLKKENAELTYKIDELRGEFNKLDDKVWRSCS